MMNCSRVRIVVVILPGSTGYLARLSLRAGQAEATEVPGCCIELIRGAQSFLSKPQCACFHCCCLGTPSLEAPSVARC